MGFKSPPSHQSYFYPRPPRGGRPLSTGCALVGKLFLSTPSARRATAARDKLRPAFPISIHALREEGDQRNLCTRKRSRYFYPRPPRGGRPARREPLKGAANISIHALREEGDLNELPDGNKEEISIHALREEGDGRASSLPTLVVNFYPRPPRGGRLRFGLCAALPVHISIHALREEGDRRVVPLFGLTLYFYPRPPRGGRPPSQDRRGTTQNFYPRPPRGGRLGCRWALSRASRFLSTPSARRATRRRPRQRPVGRISIHALREEGDEPAAEAPAPTGISIHALREEGDLAVDGICGPAS